VQGICTASTILTFLVPNPVCKDDDIDRCPQFIGEINSGPEIPCYISSFVTTTSTFHRRKWSVLTSSF